MVTKNWITKCVLILGDAMNILLSIDTYLKDRHGLINEATCAEWKSSYKAYNIIKSW